MFVEGNYTVVKIIRDDIGGHSKIVHDTDAMNHGTWYVSQRSSPSLGDGHTADSCSGRMPKERSNLVGPAAQMAGVHKLSREGSMRSLLASCTSFTSSSSSQGNPQKIEK